MKKGILLTAIVLCLAGFWVASEVRYVRAVRPPRGVDNLTSFLSFRPALTRIHQFSWHGKKYFGVIGDAKIMLLNVPSGPPAYVFDDRGSLIDWCGDTGDDSVFRDRWSGLFGGSRISREQALISSTPR